MQAEARALAPHVPKALLDGALSAGSVRDFDERYVAPLAGYAGADDYYARCSLPTRLGRIATPTLCLTAQDDPWIPADTYRAIAWGENPRVAPLIAAGGGHVGFHDAVRDGSWADRAIAAWAAPHLRPDGSDA